MYSKKQKVLIIDDNEEIRDLVARTLHGTEFHVLQASDGSESIRIAKEHKPDVILLDIIMPKFDGYLTGKVLKRNISTKKIPIIFLTGKKTKEDINAAVLILYFKTNRSIAMLLIRNEDFKNKKDR